MSDQVLKYLNNDNSHAFHFVLKPNPPMMPSLPPINMLFMRESVSHRPPQRRAEWRLYFNFRVPLVSDRCEQTIFTRLMLC